MNNVGNSSPPASRATRELALSALQDADRGLSG